MESELTRILCLLSRPVDQSAAELLETIRATPSVQTTTLDLTREGVDYDLLLSAILEADSVQTW